ncbi:MAG: 50S ribosomal protein L9 [Candidatus Omnitrophica bacterium]|nr:50S ribosomal protein L9 [Candidatus Omnitrophota bacterium]
MEVILHKDVEKIGKRGQVVKVKDGFARNFLLPQKLAIPATADNLQKVAQEQEKKKVESAKVKKEFEVVKERLAGLSLTMPVLTQDDESLYGSITAQDIVNALQEEGVTLDKSTIVMPEPIKALGIYEIPVKLHAEVEAKVKIWVVKK